MGNSIHPKTNRKESYSSIDESDSIFACCLKKFKECCEKAPKYIFDHTVGSCSCQSYFCCGKNSDYYYKEIKDEESLKKVLKFHFMDPFEKWNSKDKEQRRFPWKLVIQIFSIIFVTLQLILFADTMFYVTDFVNENSHTFSKLFVANPQLDTSDPTTDPIPDPIAHLYTLDEVLDQINFTASAYFNLENRAVGTYGYEWADFNNDAKVMKRLIVKVSKYANGEIDPTNLIADVNEQDIAMEEYPIYKDQLDNSSLSVADAIMWSKLVEDRNIIEKINVELNISSVSIVKVDSFTDNPKCFQFTILLTIRKDYNSGSMPLTFEIRKTLTRDCVDNSEIYLFDTSFDSSTGRIVLSCCVVITSTILIFLSVRSLLNTLHLACRIRRFLKPKMDNFQLKMLKSLFDIWHVVVIISDLLAVLGTIFKLLLSLNVVNDINVVDGTSIIFGLAVFGQWCGLLRFLGYFGKYNMLLRTLKNAAPKVLRFLLCTGILYIAFLLCGWLVMGPYHPKFRTFDLSSECLFSLINGDDMFNTFIMVSNASKSVKIFAEIYLYAFVVLFIYVVLSVFISLIEETYRTVHDEWKERQSAADESNKKMSQFLRNFVEGLAEIQSHQRQTTDNGAITQLQSTLST